MQWICIIFSFILVIVYSVCCLCAGKPDFPFGTKHNGYHRMKEASLGLPLHWDWEIPWPSPFFFSLFGSSTRQQIKSSQVQNLKEILCSSGTKFKLLAGSREYYGDWKGTSFGSFPSTCVYACVQMVGALELSKYSLLLTHQASSAVTRPSFGCSWRGQHSSYAALNAYISVGCKI